MDEGSVERTCKTCNLGKKKYTIDVWLFVGQKTGMVSVYTVPSTQAHKGELQRSTKRRCTLGVTAETFWVEYIEEVEVSIA